MRTPIALLVCLSACSGGAPPDPPKALPSRSSAAPLVHVPSAAPSAEPAEPSIADAPAPSTPLHFGTAIARSEDVLAVAATRDKEAPNGGAVQLLVRGGDTWTHHAELEPADGTFRSTPALSMDGETILVGGWKGRGGEDDPGAAYVFARLGDAWSQQAKLVADDGAPMDELGSAVSLSGDTALVGAGWSDRVEQDAGAAYVFERQEGRWTQQATFSARGAKLFDHFGGEVLLHGDVAIVAAPGEDVEGPNNGAAYVFERRGVTWHQRAKLTAGLRAAAGYYESQFGASLAMDGDTVLVGAPGHDQGKGAVYVFVKRGTSFQRHATLTAVDNHADAFGSSVHLSGDTAFIGAYNYGPSEEGRVYVFTRTGAMWKQTAALEVPASSEHHEFGTSLVGDRSMVFVGAPGSVFSKDRPGVVFGFALSGNTWTKTLSLSPK